MLSNGSDSGESRDRATAALSYRIPRPSGGGIAARLTDIPGSSDVFHGGIVAYDNAVKTLVFGADSEPVTSGRVATVQAIGGTGGLKIGADFLKKVSPQAKVLISDPSWENHRALFTNAGFEVDTYAYYDAAKRGVNFDGMLASLNAAVPGTIVVLHACCHNPTGYDITPAQWDQVIAVVKSRGLTPFLDMAYQGFGYGITEDGAVIGKFVAAGLTFFVSTSFSKSFSLYGERVGGLSVLCENKDEASRVLSQLKIVIRTNYSNPPIHGSHRDIRVLPVSRYRRADGTHFAERSRPRGCSGASTIFQVSRRAVRLRFAGSPAQFDHVFAAELRQVQVFDFVRGVDAVQRERF